MKKIIYLSFDDGPHPLATPFVLDTLQQYQAKATFFCIGKNVVEHPAIFHQIIAEGHSVGNHTFNHLNGWDTNTHLYLNNIEQAKKYIPLPLFRPPYGRITQNQLKLLPARLGLTTIMWTILSGDFDVSLSKEKCLHNVLNKTKQGAIVVFHDSDKAYEKLVFTLPKVLDHFTRQGYRFHKINFN